MLCFVCVSVHEMSSVVLYCVVSVCVCDMSWVVLYCVVSVCLCDMSWVVLYCVYTRNELGDSHVVDQQAVQAFLAWTCTGLHMHMLHSHLLCMYVLHHNLCSRPLAHCTTTFLLYMCMLHHRLCSWTYCITTLWY